MLSENNESNLDNESNIDYVPCKPASHKTTMEPKCNKLFVNYNGIATQKTKQVVRRKVIFLYRFNSIFIVFNIKNLRISLNSL